MPDRTFWLATSGLFRGGPGLSYSSIFKYTTITLGWRGAPPGIRGSAPDSEMFHSLLEMDPWIWNLGFPR